MSHDVHGVFHPLGTDRLGRDVWARLVYGARVSLLVGVLGMAVSLLIGITIGAAAAAAPPAGSALLLGATDFALGLPRVVLLLLLAALGAGHGGQRAVGGSCAGDRAGAGGGWVYAGGGRGAGAGGWIAARDRGGGRLATMVVGSMEAPADSCGWGEEIAGRSRVTCAGL